MKHITTIFSFFILVVFFPGKIDAQEVKTKVTIRVMEEASGKITPVMICITGIEDGKVRLPPSGAISESPSKTEVFYQGIEYKKDRNWVGPVRKMNGMGDNDDRSYVYELLPSIPHWKAPALYQTSGDFTIEILPGRWQINLEHGNEYIPIEETFEISGKEKSITKTYRLKRWIDLPQQGWYSGDVHVHHPTNRSAYREFLMEYAKAEDVHLVNTLEMGHHLGTDFHQEGFGESFRTCAGDICLVSGQEDPRSTFGHIIGLNIDQMERDTSTYDYYDLVFKKLHQQPGAVVGFAHFSWNGCDLPRGFPWYITTEAIDFVELLQFSKINTIDYYDYLNLGFRITAAAGSDIPWGSTLGEVRTFVYTGKNFSADSWFAGLKAGRTFVSNGPALLFKADNQLPGAEIRKAKGAVALLEVMAVSHPGIGTIERMAIYNNDGLLSDQSNPRKLDSLHISMEHLIKKSQWIAAVVYCANGAVAHTTPVYFLVDGQPTWEKTKAPGIIKRQLVAIQQIEEETKANTPVDEGIIQRLEMARDFYKKLDQQINQP